MKKVLELTYSRNPKLTGAKQYEMDSAMFSEKVIIELNGETDEEITALRKKHQSILEESVNNNAKRWEEAHRLDMSGLRVRVFDGLPCPSVTSILNIENSFKYDPQYSDRGQEIENVVFEFIDTGVWREPIKPLVSICYSDIKYKEFFSKFKDQIDFKDHKKKIEVWHKRYKYSGEIDLTCKVNGIESICDLKTGAWHWPQLIAYHYTKQVKADQLAIFDLKNCKLETLKPNDPKYAEGLLDFMVKRGQVKAMYGI